MTSDDSSTLLTSWLRSSSSGPMSTQEQAGRGGRAGTHHRHSLGRAAFQHGPAASGHVHNQVGWLLGTMTDIPDILPK